MQVPGVKMSGCISYIYSWAVVITDTARAWFFYSVYTMKNPATSHREFSS